jgi:uncharacterized paraquat-inducible protein A
VSETRLAVAYRCSEGCAITLPAPFATQALCPECGKLRNVRRLTKKEGGTCRRCNGTGQTGFYWRSKGRCYLCNGGQRA